MIFSIFRKEEQIDHAAELEKWNNSAKDYAPPHIVKQLAIKAVAVKYGLQVLVETGTYMGHMVRAQLPNFKTIYSIELSRKLYIENRWKFRKESSVKLLKGDSGKVLEKLVPALSQPALFWLDGHYSMGITAKGEKNCPLIEELHAIFKSPLPHIILIDDARCFNGTDDYPTIAEIESLISTYQKNLQVSIQEDIIYLTPR